MVFNVTFNNISVVWRWSVLFVEETGVPGEHNRDEFEDTKWVIKSLRSKKDKQCNGQKKEKERTKNDQQNTTQKTKDRAARTPLKTNNDRQNTTQKTKD
jgi:hypothetical protein